MPALNRHTLLALSGFAVLLGGLGIWGTSQAAEETRALPLPEADGPVTTTVVFAGGCFWGVQGVFQHVTGVISAVSGYAGGDQASADYHMVSSGRTRHAEVVQVRFDPLQVSYGQLLQVFFSVAHDPTQLNRQGPDSGTQYRSAIFPADAEQARLATAYIAQLDQARLFGAAIVTKSEPDQTFFLAEDYHQDYLTRHPNQPYIAINDMPKIAALQRLLPQRYRATPVLVATAG